MINFDNKRLQRIFHADGDAVHSRYSKVAEDSFIIHLIGWMRMNMNQSKWLIEFVTSINVILLLWFDTILIEGITSVITNETTVGNGRFITITYNVLTITNNFDYDEKALNVISPTIIISFE